ncbi:MAG: hypothetical protein F6K09_06110 [Merismopedia sp. SIO2A8]|nr:hypothetical protein [Merismopedia sp. SIO2A8]
MAVMGWQVLPLMILMRQAGRDIVGWSETSGCDRSQHKLFVQQRLVVT